MCNLIPKPPQVRVGHFTKQECVFLSAALVVDIRGRDLNAKDPTTGSPWIFQSPGRPTVCLGSTKCLCLRWKLEQVNLLQMTPKLVSVIEMTLLYAAQSSCVLLRPNIEVQLSTQSADKWICTGKWPVSSVAEFIHHVLVVPCVPEFFFPNADGSLVLGKLNSSTTRPGGGGETIQTLELRGPSALGKKTPVLYTGDHENVVNTFRYT